MLLAGRANPGSFPPVALGSGGHEVLEACGSALRPGVEMLTLLSGTRTSADLFLQAVAGALTSRRAVGGRTPGLAGCLTGTDEDMILQP